MCVRNFRCFLCSRAGVQWALPFLSRQETSLAIFAEKVVDSTLPFALQAVFNFFGGSEFFFFILWRRQKRFLCFSSSSFFLTFLSPFLSPSCCRRFLTSPPPTAFLPLLPSANLQVSAECGNRGVCVCVREGLRAFGIRKKQER